MDARPGSVRRGRQQVFLAPWQLVSILSSSHVSCLKHMQISSASNCTDYQSRRLGIRFRPAPLEPPPATNSKKGKGASSGPTKFVHTLNATAVAVPRLIISILENFQQEDGTVVIPEPLRPFMGGLGVLIPKTK